MRLLKKLPKAQLIFFTLAIFIVCAAVYLSIHQVLSASYPPKSNLNITSDGDKIIFTTTITPYDQSVANQFFEEVGLSNQQVKHIAFVFDQTTTQFFKQIAPVNLNLDFVSPKKVQFFGSLGQGYVRPLSLAGSYQISTQGASLNYSSARGNKLIIHNPQKLVIYATQSGILNVSAKLNTALTNLAKVSTIEIHIDNGKISGSILLK